MNPRLACLVAAVLAIAASASRVIASVSEPLPDVEILVNGTPQHRYPHQGRWYIEALKGQYDEAARMQPGCALGARNTFR